MLIGWSGLAHPVAFIRKAALQQVGGYRAEYTAIEDKDLWLRLAEIGRLANLPETLLHYRLHENSISHRKANDVWRLWELLLAETYKRRGLRTSPPSFAARRRKAAKPGRTRAGWVRAAARAGNYATATKHARLLIKEHPLRLLTWITLARAAASTLRNRRPSKATVANSGDSR
jgi:hypothetical protein